MQYPDTERLIAIGKYSFLNRERREQIARVQSLSKLIMHKANPLLDDCQAKPPIDVEPLTTLETCVKNAAKARTRIEELCAEMATLEPVAWPK